MFKKLRLFFCLAYSTLVFFWYVNTVWSGLKITFKLFLYWIVKRCGMRLILVPIFKRFTCWHRLPLLELHMSWRYLFLKQSTFFLDLDMRCLYRSLPLIVFVQRIWMVWVFIAVVCVICTWVVVFEFIRGLKKKELVIRLLLFYFLITFYCGSLNSRFYVIKIYSCFVIRWLDRSWRLSVLHWSIANLLDLSLILG